MANARFASPKQMTTHGHYSVLGRVEAYVALEAGASLPWLSFGLVIRHTFPSPGSHLVN